MRESLTIVVAQPRCVPYDVLTNAQTHAATIRSGGARVVVFPELSLTGYELDAPPVAIDDRRLAPIVQACAETGSVALVGALGVDAYIAGTLMFSDGTDEQNKRASRIATDHGVWVAVASFAGSTGDGYDKAAGCSGIWSPDGVVLAQAGPDAGAVARATLSPEAR